MRKPAVVQTKTWNKDLKPGDALEGEYLQQEVYDSAKYGLTKKYIIKTKEGLKGVYGSASLGNQFLNIPEGSYVWIVYKGEEMSSNGRRVKVYSVDYDDEYVAPKE